MNKILSSFKYPNKIILKPYKHYVYRLSEETQRLAETQSELQGQKRLAVELEKQLGRQGLEGYFFCLCLCSSATFALLPLWVSPFERTESIPTAGLGVECFHYLHLEFECNAL